MRQPIAPRLQLGIADLLARARHDEGRLIGALGRMVSRIHEAAFSCWSIRLFRMLIVRLWGLSRFAVNSSEHRCGRERAAAMLSANCPRHPRELRLSSPRMRGPSIPEYSSGATAYHSHCVYWVARLSR